MKPSSIRLIFHIGAGKTGTSSIQNTLRNSVDLLKSKGIWYLGLMLEHAPEHSQPWQIASGSETFHATEATAAGLQLHQVLFATVAAAREAGVHTLVWSNESFFDRNSKARSTLKALIEDGVDVRFVAYVRRHDAWSRSAYVQWAIKHKTNIGPVMRFQDWFKRRPARFAPALQSLIADFPGRLLLRNLDTVKDAVPDFLALLPLGGATIPETRDNVTPDSVEILLRALFNTRVKEKILPVRFDRLVGRHADFNQTPGEYLRALMPTDEDLREVRVQCAADRSALNELLRANAQEAIATDELAGKRVDVDDGKLLLAMAQLMMHQAHRIERMEAALKRAGVNLGEVTD
jgi:hypothetical protein